MSYPKNSAAPPTADQRLIGFVREIEAHEDRIAGENTGKSEIYKTAKGEGFNVKALRKVVAARRKDPIERSQEDADFELYWDAVHGIAHARVEIIEQIDPETGEITEPPVPQHEAVEAGEDVVTAASSPDTIPEPETGAPSSPSVSAAGDGGAGLPAAASVVPSNVTPIRTHNPATHFLNSEGLHRLHGCLAPEACGSGQPRLKLCFNCSVVHDGPSPQNGVA